MSKKISFTYKGVIAPVFTPFNIDNERSLNLSIIPAYAKYLAKRHINGILVSGTTGEGTSLSVHERKAVAEAWGAAVKETKQHLMVQIGGTSLKDVKELAKHAEQLGANSLLCLPELYFKPKTVEDLTEYLKIVSMSATSTPLLYYHYPNASMVDIHMGKFLESIGNKIPTFCGIKFTSNDLDEGFQAMKTDSNLTIFLGSDTLMSAGCALGMDSFIMTSLNFIPEPALELLEFRKGNRSLKDAQEKQEYITKIIKTVTKHGTWVETMKMAMNLTTDLFVGPPRAPLKLLNPENVESMAKDLTNLGLSVNKNAVLKID